MVYDGGRAPMVYDNKRGAVEKYSAGAQLIPDKITECAFSATDTCFDNDGKTALKTTFGTTNIGEIKAKTGCTSQKCIAAMLPREIAIKQLRRNFKIPGPTGVQLLSNFNIDSILEQMEAKFPWFYSFGFSMKNGKEYTYECEPNAAGERVLACDVFAKPDRANSVSVSKLLAAGKKAAATVINTDVYQNGGKHWMALYIDTAGSVEFFNSSGNAPCAEIINWLTARCEELIAAGIDAKVVRVCRFRHQHSRTECGVYSLFYIYARLNGIPVEYFMNEPVPDQLMMEFRQHLFDNSGPSGLSTIDLNLAAKAKLPPATFSWDEFARNVKIQWE